MNKYKSIGTGSISIAVILVLSISIPIQFIDARYNRIAAQNFDNDCDKSNCANTNAASDNQGSAIALPTLQ